VAVPISGGLDSRTTVALLTEPRRPAPERLWAYTYGYGEDSVETAIGRRVAEARGLPVRSISIGRYLFDRLDDVMGAVEGFQDVTQTRQAAVADLLARDADAVVAAHWGDVWLDDMGAAHAGSGAAGLAEHAFAKVRKRGRDWLLREVAAPLVPGADPEALARRFVAAELERVGDLGDRDFQVKAFKTDQWSFRWTAASLRAYRLGAFPLLPFYDTRVADFFATVPTEQVAGRALQIELLRRFAPDLARVPWQAFGTDLFRLRHWNTWLLPWRAARKAARLLRRRPAAPERNWEVQFSGPGRARLEERLLAPGRRVHGLVAPDRISRLLAEFDAAPLEGGRGYTVSMLLTLSAALERHVG
jgi:asparagine synthetase B (glutamine-hydrolysing)